MAGILCSIVLVQGVRAAIITTKLYDFLHFAPGVLVQTADGGLYGASPTGGTFGLGEIFQVLGDGTLRPVLSFSGANGASPQGGLTLLGDGSLLGVTAAGGTNGGFGTLFKVTTNGVLTSLASFNQTNGGGPTGLRVGLEGNYYGTTATGGRWGGGTFFTYSPGGGLQALAHFGSTNMDNAAAPQGRPLQLSNGAFYGICAQGGLLGAGTVWAYLGGGTLTNLFTFAITNGFQPQSSLVLAPDGSFYGTTSFGGDNDVGTIFNLNAAGHFTLLASLDATTGSPAGDIVLGADGNIYGAAPLGGSAGGGAVFQCVPTVGASVFANFGGANGAGPISLLTGHDGSFYGICTNAGPAGAGSVFRCDSTTRNVSRLAAISSPEGLSPVFNLLAGQDGNLYGLTSAGGAAGFGTVFKATLGGQLTILASFPDAPPNGPLLQGADGNLYGCCQPGVSNLHGSLYRVTTAGVFSTLAAFSGTNGDSPVGRLLQLADGNFYGATLGGGLKGDGVVFQLTPSRALNLIYSFSGPDGNSPNGSLVADPLGNLLGTTTLGGNGNYGVLFRLTTSGSLLATNYFGGASGRYPDSGLIVGANEVLYGTTVLDGNQVLGGVFRANSSLSFVNSVASATGLISQLTPGKDGSLYAIQTSSSGGTLVELTAGGALAGLVASANLSAGSPLALVQAGDGNFYGITAAGGVDSVGSLFRVSNLGAAIDSPPADQSLLAGGTAHFAAVVNGIQPLNYQWLRNGVAVPGATQTTLNLTNVQSAQAGAYSLYASNYYGAALSSSAALTVVPFVFTGGAPDGPTPPPGLLLRVPSGAGLASVVITTSTNLYNWTPLYTNPPGAGAFSFQDPLATPLPKRFYRAEIR